MVFNKVNRTFHCIFYHHFFVLFVIGFHPLDKVTQSVPWMLYMNPPVLFWAMKITFDALDHKNRFNCKEVTKLEYHETATETLQLKKHAEKLTKKHWWLWQTHKMESDGRQKSLNLTQCTAMTFSKTLKLVNFFVFTETLIRWSCHALIIHISLLFS